MARGALLAPALAGVALAVAGCATPSRLPPPGSVAIPAGEAGPLVERWEAAWRAFHGLRATVELTVRRGDRTDRVAGLLLVSPTSLRFEALAPFGLPALVVVARPDALTVFRPVDRTAWTGQPTPATVRRWLGIPIAPETLIPLLVGRVPLPPDPPGVRVEAGSTPHLVFDRGPVHHRVWVTPEGEPAQVQMDGDEQIAVSFVWTTADVLQSVRVDVPARRAQVALRYISAEPTIPPAEAFELSLPPDVKVQRLD